MNHTKKNNTNIQYKYLKMKTTFSVECVIQLDWRFFLSLSVSVSVSLHIDLQQMMRFSILKTFLLLLLKKNPSKKITNESNVFIILDPIVLVKQFRPCVCEMCLCKQQQQQKNQNKTKEAYTNRMPTDYFLFFFLTKKNVMT